MQSPLGDPSGRPAPLGLRPGGFFLRPPVNRVAFLVDGFNVYHSLREVQATLGRAVKWLDLQGLCESYTRRSLFGRKSVVQSVTYFSAYATFLVPTNPGALDRHRSYVRALQATGVVVALGR